MKILKPSFEIHDDLDNSSIAVRLEACARVCYKSEDQITEESAIPFVTRIAEQGQNWVLEMAVVSFKVTCHPDHVLELLSCQTKFLVIDRIDTGLLLTGSIRTFRELYAAHPYNRLVYEIVAMLAAKEPPLFQDVFDPDKGLQQDSQVGIEKLSLQEVDELPSELKLRHRFVSVKFIVNRAVTHELVRHRPCSFLQESQRYCRYNQDKFDNQVTFIKPIFFPEDGEEFKMWQQAMELAEAKYMKLLDSSTPQAARTVLPNSCKTEIIAYCNLEEWQHIFFLGTSESAEPSMREILVPLEQEMKKRFFLT